MRCTWTREVLVVAIFVAMTFARNLHAQEYRAEITGPVTDSSKAIVNKPASYGQSNNPRLRQRDEVKWAGIDILMRRDNG